MKSALVFILLVGVATAQFNNLGGGSMNTGFSAGAPTTGGAAGATGGAAGGANTGNPWGARAYGMGLNNPWAIPPNPFMMRRALALIDTVPGALVRVDVNGQVEITNQFGQEVDIHDRFGNDLTDLYDF